MELNIRNKFFYLQKAKRPRIFLDETSELVERNENVGEEIVVVDENSDPDDLSNVYEPELVNFVKGTTNKGGICYWHAGLLKIIIQLKNFSKDFDTKTEMENIINAQTLIVQLRPKSQTKLVWFKGPWEKKNTTIFPT